MLFKIIFWQPLITVKQPKQCVFKCIRCTCRKSNISVYAHLFERGKPKIFLGNRFLALDGYDAWSLDLSVFLLIIHGRWNWLEIILKDRHCLTCKCTVYQSKKKKNWGPKYCLQSSETGFYPPFCPPPPEFGISAYLVISGYFTIKRDENIRNKILHNKGLLTICQVPPLWWNRYRQHHAVCWFIIQHSNDQKSRLRSVFGTILWMS